MLWTELWQNSVASGSSTGVVVKNGYFSVNLATYCAFAGGSCQGNTNTAVDFNQDTLWLSMDVGGTAVTNTPTYDGELLPMRRMASAVYALQASSCTTCMLQAPTSTAQNTITPTTNSVVALTVNGTSGTAAAAMNIVQAGAASNLTTSNTGATSQSLLSVSQSTSAYTGTAILVNVANGSGTFASGAFLDLQANGSSKFKIDNLGAVTLAGAQAADITTLAGATPTALVVQPGSKSQASSTGAALTLQAGNDTGATTSTGGVLTLKGGDATGSGTKTGGAVTLDSGSGATAGGAINIGATNAASINIGKTASNITTTVNGLALFKPTTGNNSTTAFRIQDAAGTTTLLDVDTTNSRLGFNVATPTLSGIGMEIQGALRLSGGLGTANNMMDSFTTPGSASIITKINIPLFDPGMFGQVLALGIPLSSNVNSRVISVFDGRTSTDNQPAIGVFSPNEGFLGELLVGRHRRRYESEDQQ